MALERKVILATSLLVFELMASLLWGSAGLVHEHELHAENVGFHTHSALSQREGTLLHENQTSLQEGAFWHVHNARELFPSRSTKAEILAISASFEPIAPWCASNLDSLPRFSRLSSLESHEPPSFFSWIQRRHAQERRSIVLRC